MKINRTYLAILILVLSILEYAAASDVTQKKLEFDAASLPNGKQIVSPDTNYSVATSENNQSEGVSRFLIKDIKTGALDKSVTFETFPYYIFWIANSQSFIAIMHIAGGSYATIVYRKNGKWTSTDYEPPNLGNTDKGIYEYYYVSKLKWDLNKINIIYEVYFKPATTEVNVPDNKTCDIEVSLKNYNILKTKVR
jgi:hypothetical protein